MDKKIAELYDAGKVDRVIHLLVKKIDHEPKRIDNYLQLSTYLLEQGSSDQAQQLLEQALHLVEKPKELYYNLAVCYYAQGEFDKALKLLDQIKNDDLTLYQKALVYLKLGQSQKALAYALTIKEVDKRVLELLGDIWLSLGDNKQAEASFRKISEEERSAKIYFLLGVSLLDHDRDQAEGCFHQSEKMDPKYYARAKKQYGSLMELISGKGRKNG